MKLNILKRKYLDCPFMKHSIHFFYDEIRACCNNVSGPIFYPDYNGESIDWDFIYSERKRIVKSINSIFRKKYIPEFCEGCCELNSFLSNTPIKKFDNIINRMYFHNNMSCNAKCTYCTYSHIQKGYRYKVLPIIKELIEKNILSKETLVYMSGGEITISPEFEELFETLTNFLNSKITILSSGIKYCKSIENAFIQNKCSMMISLDSAEKETYMKIKQVDCFDRVVNNLKNYIKISENAKDNIILKYIIVDGVNDNIQEISSFVKLVKNLGIKNIRLDFDYTKYRYTENVVVPKYYYELYNIFNELSNNLGLTIQTSEQIEAILNKNTC